MRRYGEAVRLSFQPVLLNLPLDFMEAEHQSVMLPEVLQLLQCRPGAVIVDATLGLGGHAREILERILPGGQLIGIDRDRESLEIARFRLLDYSSSIRLYHENFKNLPLVLNNLGTTPVDGILIDLGVSSYQLLSRDRGFSFQGEGMLDMRMDQSQRVTAANLVNELGEEQLADIIYRFGEERASRRIAAAIVAERSHGPITRVSQLAEVVSRAVRARGYQRIHPATRTFQALRIAVNRELEGLEDFLIQSVSFLKPGGRLVVIAFHSLEDRIVKTAFRRVSGQCVCNRPPE
jgi:16S rRNA (cytosine1402-N4)-methyltransferase